MIRAFLKKYKKELFITTIVAIVILFLKYINVLQVENHLGTPLAILVLIAGFGLSTCLIQNNIDKNYLKHRVYYENIDVLKYICALLILILHLRPFQGISETLDFTFNNIISRVGVPMFFLVTGYFVAVKEKGKENYIQEYIKKTISLYLVWSIIYIPVMVSTVLSNIPIINEYLLTVNIPTYLFVPLIIVLVPIAVIVALLYTGIYYHLWYFPAVICSLWLLSKWKKKWNMISLLVISFFLLLLGATETYYGVLPQTIQHIVSFYYNVFVTSRNFLFFGLFYIVFGYYMGTKKEVYSKYCFVKFGLSVICLIFEAIFLHDTVRLNSNILLSCIPLTYYLFVLTIYLTNDRRLGKTCRNLSKYCYFVHPLIIFVCSLFDSFQSQGPYIQIGIVLLLTYLISIVLIKGKEKLPQLMI